MRYFLHIMSWYKSNQMGFKEMFRALTFKKRTNWIKLPKYYSERLNSIR